MPPRPAGPARPGRLGAGTAASPAAAADPGRGLLPTRLASPRLDVDKEKGNLVHALARPASQGLVNVHWAPEATWAGLQDELLDGEWHVLHFIGHGDFDPGRDEGVLALTREEDGRADLVPASRLVDLLRQARPMPRLVVLNSCAGAAVGTSDLFSGTAAALVRGGVSAVAAMQYEISDNAATAFARGFYAAIGRGRGVDDAVSSGRVAILGTSDRTLEWVTPVLYLRGHQTRLFTVHAPTANLGTATSSAASVGQAASEPKVTPEPSGPATTSRPARTLAGHSDTEAVSGAAAQEGRETRQEHLAWAARLVDEAERIAYSITNHKYGQAWALSQVAGVVAVTDPGRAARLVDEAERIADDNNNPIGQAWALRGVAGAVAVTDPNRAERIANSVTDKSVKLRTLCEIALVVAVTDPGRAARLADEAERILRSIIFFNASTRESALCAVARAVASSDPDRAERIANSIIFGPTKVQALSDIAKALTV